MRPHAILLVAGLLVAACGADNSPGSRAAASVQSGTAAGHGTPALTRDNTPPSPSTLGPATRAINANLGIHDVQMASALAPDGSAPAPRFSFQAASDRRLIAVLAVSGVRPGTRISFVRWLDGKFVDTRTATLAKPSNYFYFEFTADPGKTLAPGSYRLRLYVDGTAAWEVVYAVA